MIPYTRAPTLYLISLTESLSDALCLWHIQRHDLSHENECTERGAGA